MIAHRSDVKAILAHRYDNGDDFWSTSDGRIYVGSPFSTLSSLGMLHELGVGPDHEAVKGGLGLILSACRDDGRIQMAPNAPLLINPVNTSQVTTASAVKYQYGSDPTP